MSETTLARKQVKLMPMATAAAVGNIMEWYDFTIYGFLATVFGKLFFPDPDSWTQLLSVFGVFAAGYLMRPIGSVFFGYLGDRLGRKKMLIASVVLMALPSALMGALPTYAQAGVLAPILLVVLRLVQGISVGGEFTGSSVFLVEHAPARHRGLAGSATCIGGSLGFLLASGVGTLVTRSMSPEELEAWGWRLPYAMSFLMAAVACYLRFGAVETPIFAELSESGEVAQTPLRETMLHHRREALTTFGLAWTQSVGCYVPGVFLTTWMVQAEGLKLSTALMLTTLSTALAALVVPLAGFASDRLGRKPVLLSATVGTVLLAWPLFYLMSNSGEAIWPFLVGQGALLLLSGIYNGALPTALVELAPRRTRVTTFSVSYSLAAGIFGGTTPLVCTGLIALTHDNLMPAYYLVAVGVIGTLVLWYRVQETYRLPLR